MFRKQINLHGNVTTQYDNDINLSKTDKNSSKLNVDDTSLIKNEKCMQMLF